MQDLEFDIGVGGGVDYCGAINHWWLKKATNKKTLEEFYITAAEILGSK